MKQIAYNGALGQNIIAGGIPFTAGEAVDVADDITAEALLAKVYFTEVPAAPAQAPAKGKTVTTTEGGA